MEKAPFLFFVHDRRLREKLEGGVFPHFSKEMRPVVVVHDAVINTASFLVVGISAVPKDMGIIAAEFVLRRGKKCGVIVWTEERAKWDRLSELHYQVAFQFIIALGGPHERFPIMFPGITITRGITDFEPPFGEKIARYISTFALQ